MAYNLDVNVPKLVMVGASSVLLLAIVLLGGHGYYLKAERDEFVAKYYNASNPKLDELKKTYGEHLHQYRWIDQQTGTVQIPIDQAMRIMAETKGKPPTTQPLGAP